MASGSLFSERKPVTAEQLADEFLKVLSRRSELSRSSLSEHTFAEFERSYKKSSPATSSAAPAVAISASFEALALRADWQTALRGDIAVGASEGPLLGIGLGLDEEAEKALGAEVGQWNARLLLDYVAGVVPLAEIEKRLAHAAGSAPGSSSQNALNKVNSFLAARAENVEKAIRREHFGRFQLNERVRS